MFAWRWGALVVLLVAIALAGAVSPAANSFDGKIKNDSISFLPGSAESVQVAQQLKRFPGGELVPAVVVYRRDGGLTAQDRARIAAVRGEWLTPGAVSGVRPATPVVASADGTTEVFTVPLRATGDAKRITDLVDRLRVQTKRDLPAGLKSAVTGPAGYSADAIKVFANINTKLFFSAGGLVMVLLLVIYRSPIFWILPIFSVVLAEHFVRAAGSLAIDAGLSINGQTQGILLVLVFGAGTDYALLLVARTREELHRTTDRRRAVSEALRRSGPPHPGQRRHGDRGPAGAELRGGQRHRRPRARRGHGRRAGGHRHAGGAARAAGAGTAVGVLAPHPAGGPHERRGTRRARRVAAPG
ncbi:MAG: MMPL family transporter [Thermoleophilia bacterium]